MTGQTGKVNESDLSAWVEEHAIHLLSLMLRQLGRHVFTHADWQKHQHARQVLVVAAFV